MTPSFVATCLEDRTMNSPDALSEDAIKSIAAVVYAAGKALTDSCPAPLMDIFISF